jgi:K+/H+ antiporter YhaU regulatory subunit KhtT
MIRSDELHMVRPLNLPASKRKAALDIPDVSIVSMSISDDLPHFSGKTLSQLALREKYGLTLLAIRRAEEYLTALDGDTKLEAEDIVYLFGHQSAVSKLNDPQLLHFVQ